MRYLNHGVWIFFGILASPYLLASEPVSQIFSKASDLGVQMPAENDVMLKVLANDPQWRKLLHYEKKLFSLREKSLADGPDFFLAADGSRDALAELKQTLHEFNLGDQSLKKIGPLRLNPLCAFAARREFLEKKFSVKFQNIVCKELTEFLEMGDPSSVAMVFSTAFANNPPSMLGHTFLRFHRAQSSSDLLDMSVSYAARTSEENGMLFAYLGLTGGYPGAFSFLPYYLKVAEYSQSENRDLWEYELNFSKSETLFLLKHIWEVYVSTWFDYYFFDENCSSMLMALLDVVHPEWKLSPDLFYTLPHETVQKLTSVRRSQGEAEIIRHVKFRPSLRKQALTSLATLSRAEQKVALNLAQIEGSGDSLDTKFTVEKPSADVLISSLGILRFKGKEKTKAYAKLLSQLAVTPVRKPAMIHNDRTQALAQADLSAPHFAHAPRRLGIGTGILSPPNNSERLFFRMTAHSMTHDLLNLDEGWAELSHMEFPSITLGFYPSQKNDSAKVLVENIELLRIKSLFPFNALEKKISWGVRAHYTTIKDLPESFSCAFCHVLSAEGGAGVTAFRGEGWVPSPWVLGLAQMNLGSSLPNTVNFGPVIELGALWTLGRSAKILVEFQNGFLFPRPFLFSRLNTGLSVMPLPNFDFRILGSVGFAGKSNPYDGASQHEISLTSNIFL